MKVHSRVAEDGSVSSELRTSSHRGGGGGEGATYQIRLLEITQQSPLGQSQPFAHKLMR